MHTHTHTGHICKAFLHCPASYGCQDWLLVQIYSHWLHLFDFSPPLRALDDLVTPHFSGTTALLSNYQTEQFWLQLTGCSIWKITLPFLSVHYWNGRQLWFLLVIMLIILIMLTILRYCNSRVSVYDGAGRHLHDLEGDWTVVHSLALYEQVRKYMWGCQLHYFLILMTWSN